MMVNVVRFAVSCVIGSIVGEITAKGIKAATNKYKEYKSEKNEL